MNTVLAFAGGGLIGIFLGYALAVVLVTGWSYSFTIRYGLWKALNAKDMMEFYEKAAVEERQLYALHFIQVLKEVGGPGYHLPVNESALKEVYRLAESRMNFDKKKRRFAYMSFR